VLLEKPVIVFKTADSDPSRFKEFIKPFNNDSEGYFALNHKQVHRNEFLVYGDKQMENAYSNFLKLHSWFEQASWNDKFNFNEVGLIKVSESYIQDRTSILSAYVGTDSRLVTKEFFDCLKTFPQDVRTTYLRVSATVNVQDTFFNFHKQKGDIFDLSATRYSIMHKTIQNLWVRSSFQRNTLLANEGLPVSDFLQLMDVYTNDLNELLMKKNIDVTTKNIISLHNLSHVSQMNNFIYSLIVRFGFERKFATKVDRLLDMVERGITIEFIQALQLAGITIDNEEYLTEVLDLWNELPIKWFFKLHMLNRPDKI
jgi:hypothetical protein